MAENGLIAGIAISIMFNIIVIAFLFATGMGRQIYKRFKQRFAYSSGKYVNTLLVNKSGNAKEYFKHVEKDGSFKINDKRYIRDPKAAFNYEKIPTMIHLEDVPAPINIYDTSQENMSCGELDTVIMANTQFDLQEFLRKWLPFILIGAVILVGAIAVMAYFNYMNYEMLRDGTAPALQAVTNAVKPV